MPRSCRRRASTSSTSSSLPDGPDDVLLDVKADRAAALAQRLGMYRLRAKVAIAARPARVVVGTGEPPRGRLRRSARPGARLARARCRPAALLAGAGPARHRRVAAARVAPLVPETGVELLPDDSYILETRASSGCTASTSARAATSARR